MLPYTIKTRTFFKCRLLVLGELATFNEIVEKDLSLPVEYVKYMK